VPEIGDAPANGINCPTDRRPHISCLFDNDRTVRRIEAAHDVAGDDA
jgi:hypothetical protein